LLPIAYNSTQRRPEESLAPTIRHIEYPPRSQISIHALKPTYTLGVSNPTPPSNALLPYAPLSEGRQEDPLDPSDLLLEVEYASSHTSTFIQFTPLGPPNIGTSPTTKQTQERHTTIQIDIDNNKRARARNSHAGGYSLPKENTRHLQSRNFNHTHPCPASL